VPPPPPAQPTHHQTQTEEEVGVPEAEEHSKHVTVTEAAAPAEPAAAQATVLPSGVAREGLAATKIQTAFRGYLVM